MSVCVRLYVHVDFCGFWTLGVRTSWCIGAHTCVKPRKMYISTCVNPSIPPLNFPFHLPSRLQSHIITEEDDRKKLKMAREKMRATGSGQLESAEDSLMKKAMAGMGDDDWALGGELTVDNKSYTWSDKYRPRKPRYDCDAYALVGVLVNEFWRIHFNIHVKSAVWLYL